MGKNYSKKYVLLCAFLMLSIMAFAQNGSISGKIVDEHGQPLPGATATVNGTTSGAAADANGNYVIRGVKPGAYTVTARFVGYKDLSKSVTVPASGNVTAQFQLQPAATALNEIVVVGYGTQRKKDLTGSVAVVTAKDFNQGPITTPEQLIQGKVAGVSITSNSGAPGSGSTIRIRGGASLNASNDPLIVIDGVPLSGESISGLANPLSSINPDDIESFNVLKDASATAIYGSRASNGVIIITTKKGNANEKFTVNFSSINSLSKITKEVSVLNTAQFRNAVQTQFPSGVSELGNSSTNWQNQIYRQAYGTDNNISFSGGVKGLPYRLSLGFSDQDGVLKTDNFKRTSAALNISHSFLRNSLKIDVNLKGTYTDSHFANNGAIGAALAFDPTQPVYSGSNRFGGFFEYLSGNAPNTLAPRNPVGLLMEQDGRGTSKRGIGSVNINYVFPFLKDLQANATIGGDIADGEGHTLVPDSAASAYTSHGSFSRYFKENSSYNTDYYLKYSKDFKSINSHFDIQAGYSYQFFKFYTRNEQTYAADMVTPIGSPSNNVTPEYSIESPFARLNFSLQDKYLLTASIRDDRSTRFSSSNRNGYFPAIALAWRLKEESFLKDVNFLSDLKLRASYGITGQQGSIGSSAVYSYFPYLAVYEPSNSSAGYQFGNSYVNTLRADAYNTGLKWEQTATSNIGFDYGLFNGRINGAIDYYYRKTKNLLVDTPVPDGTNLTNHVIANVGTLHAQGLEFSVNVNAVNTKDINWTFGYNLAYNNVIVDNISLTKDPNQVLQVGGIGGGVGNTIQLDKAGYAPNTFYVYQQVYNQNGQPLEGVYVDRNGNGTTQDDKYLDKKPAPTVTMGFNNSLSYKKWNLGFTMRANLGNYMYNNTASANGAYAGLKFAGYLNNLPASVLKTNFQNYQLYSDYYIENASFLRMDNANLSYNFGKIAKGVTLRLSANVQNVFVITKYTGLDPENYNATTPGIDNNFYPRPRIYSIGINAGF